MSQCARLARGFGACACVLAVVLVGCAGKTKAKDSAAPSAPAATGGGDFKGAKAEAAEESEGAGAIDSADELDELDTRVDQAWSELEILDDAREQASTSPEAEPGAAAARCERIQALAQHICTLRDRVCGLATEHPGQSRYASACARSEETCTRAHQAALRCPVG